MRAKVTITLFLLTAVYGTVPGVTFSFAGDGSETTAGAPGFYVDVSQFYAGSATELEIYVGVPLTGLESVEVNENLVYSFTVGAQLETGDGELIDRDVISKTAVLPKSDTRGASLSVAQVSLAAPPGEYVLTCGVGDLNVETSRVREMDIIVTKFDTGEPAFSDLEVASSIAAADEGMESEFIKSGYQVIPNPTKLISDRQGELLVYYELYGLGGTESEPFVYDLHYTIQLVNGKVYLRNKEVLKAASDAVSKVGDFDLAGFPAGPYVLAIRLMAAGDASVLAETSKEFIYYHEVTPEEVAEFRSKYLPFTKAEAERIRREISYVATKSELEAFDAMSDEDRPIFIELFWKRRDPTPQTEENEFKDAFYERFDYAEAHFSTPFLAGADSDMGYIYIKFGEPEDVSREPGGLPSETGYEGSTWQTEPFEVWEYYIDGKLRWFLFVDYDGDGDYYLDSSNEPGYGRYVSPGSSSN
ncbi:MAG: GWxTD domain-containing protein [Candidatus Coatesbacteria bacterium]|nr:MAG: GWxTD domain-containing protein [Candidatus Coatesbacteria bacterium]